MNGMEKIYQVYQVLYPAVYAGVLSHLPRPIFHARYLHSWKCSVGANKVGVVNISPRAFRRRIVRFWYLPACGAIELGKTPQGGVIYTVVLYGRLHE